MLNNPTRSEREMYDSKTPPDDDVEPCCWTCSDLKCRKVQAMGGRDLKTLCCEEWKQ